MSTSWGSRVGRPEPRPDHVHPLAHIRRAHRQLGRLESQRILPGLEEVHPGRQIAKGIPGGHVDPGHRGVRRATYANRAVQVPNDLDEIIKAIEVYS